MIGMGAEASTIMRAEATDFFRNCRTVKIPSDKRVGDVPGSAHYQWRVMLHHHSRGWSRVDRRQAIQAHIVCSNEGKRNNELYGATKVFPFFVDAHLQFPTGHCPSTLLSIAISPN
jgi:hypothetical protein